jgi:hypothetical protein
VALRKTVPLSSQDSELEHPDKQDQPPVRPRVTVKFAGLPGRKPSQDSSACMRGADGKAFFDREHTQIPLRAKSQPAIAVSKLSGVKPLTTSRTAGCLRQSLQLEQTFLTREDIPAAKKPVDGGEPLFDDELDVPEASDSEGEDDPANSLLGVCTPKSLRIPRYRPTMAILDEGDEEWDAANHCNSRPRKIVGHITGCR